ncbi:MAG TPA: ABC transporter ATP-binding protein [Candidatus Bathyarchaeota archaeon]|nr:MAG: multidrug ABC transporter ATP-binding protein [Candidatus Bathyarchaeota archaeon ex4484_231]HDI07349.1 ABC transporter ATP-binding protein [Candidatus Bathyarchaeota archaeon]
MPLLRLRDGKRGSAATVLERRNQDALNVIVTEGLTKCYGKIIALDDLNLKIAKEHCVGFLGPNGAGKSTTIKILCNLIRPTQGKAYVLGFDVSAEAEKALKNIGAIVEVPEFYPFLNPKETLSYLGKLRGMTGSVLEERIREVLELVRLREWADTKIGNFSRGMKQRLGIAQAVLHDPEVLILDEPALGLDPRGMYEIREIIKTLVAEGKTVFLASHMLHEVRELCDSVALINKGKLIAHDNVENLEKIFKVQQIEIETLKPPTKKQEKEIAEFKAVRQVTIQNNRITVEFEGDETQRAEFLGFLIKKVGMPIISFNPSSKGLEEVYLRLVKEVS